MKKESLVLVALMFSGEVSAAETNIYLANSPWPITHQNSAATGSSPLYGPNNAWELLAPQYVDTGFINITQAMSPKYTNGNMVYWGSNVTSVYKLAVVKGRLTKISSINKPGDITISLKTPTSGAYTFVGSDGIFYTVQGKSILAYGDNYPLDMNSAIALRHSFILKDSVVSADDAVVGLNITSDGRLAFATRRGVVGVLTRDFKTAQYLNLPSDEEVSNSIATDEKGGIYVVSSKAQYRLQSSMNSISLDVADGAWRAEYDAGVDQTGNGRLGSGSGSTPSLAAGPSGQRFVVITDGAAVAKIVYMWRDKIPDDWKAIAPGKDRRIAAELPIDFGDPKRQATVDEQSVLVHGYGAVVVSNDYGKQVLSMPKDWGQIANGWVILNSAKPWVQPKGVQKFEWNPVLRKLKSTWVRNDVSCPNGIPTMSELSSRFYCVGATPLGAWTIESLDWKTGLNRFTKVLGFNHKYNSFYSSTQLTGDGGIIYGSTTGVVYLPTLLPKVLK